MPGLSTSEACGSVRTTRQETRIRSAWLEGLSLDWELGDKTDPRSGKGVLVAVSAEDVFFRENITVRARFSGL